MNNKHLLKNHTQKQKNIKTKMEQEYDGPDIDDEMNEFIQQTSSIDDNKKDTSDVKEKKTSEKQEVKQPAPKVAPNQGTKQQTTNSLSTFKNPDHQKTATKAQPTVNQKTTQPIAQQQTKPIPQQQTVAPKQNPVPRQPQKPQLPAKDDQVTQKAQEQPKKQIPRFGAKSTTLIPETNNNAKDESRKNRALDVKKADPVKSKTNEEKTVKPIEKKDIQKKKEVVVPIEKKPIKRKLQESSDEEQEAKPAKKNVKIVQDKKKKQKTQDSSDEESDDASNHKKKHSKKHESDDDEKKSNKSRSKAKSRSSRSSKSKKQESSSEDDTPKPKKVIRKYPVSPKLNKKQSWNSTEKSTYIENYLTAEIAKHLKAGTEEHLVAKNPFEGIDADETKLKIINWFIINKRYRARRFTDYGYDWANNDQLNATPNPAYAKSEKKTVATYSPDIAKSLKDFVEVTCFLSPTEIDIARQKIQEKNLENKKKREIESENEEEQDQADDNLDEQDDADQQNDDDDNDNQEQQSNEQDDDDDEAQQEDNE